MFFLRNYYILALFGYKCMKPICVLKAHSFMIHIKTQYKFHFLLSFNKMNVHINKLLHQY